MEGGTEEKKRGGGGNQRQIPLRDGIRAPNPSHQATCNPPSEAVTLPGVMDPRERVQGREMYCGPHSSPQTEDLNVGALITNTPPSYTL